MHLKSNICFTFYFITNTTRINKNNVNMHHFKADTFIIGNKILTCMAILYLFKGLQSWPLQQGYCPRIQLKICCFLIHTCNKKEILKQITPRYPKHSNIVTVIIMYHHYYYYRCTMSSLFNIKVMFWHNKTFVFKWTRN
jgi:hypothetical protein